MHVIKRTNHVTAKQKSQAQLPQRKRASNIALSYTAEGILICQTASRCAYLLLSML